jgi:hypothetical protein
LSQKGRKLGSFCKISIPIGQPVYSTFATENKKIEKATEVTENTERLMYKMRRFIGLDCSFITGHVFEGVSVGIDVFDEV